MVAHVVRAVAGPHPVEARGVIHRVDVDRLTGQPVGEFIGEGLPHVAQPRRIVGAAGEGHIHIRATRRRGDRRVLRWVGEHRGRRRGYREN
ncbi:Uncharacterised protein [Mycobacteroides abscessus subsp. massiliense]|nr:Uncharacterised protein [Mycobacteroides abscessus subsp. massiliense]